MERHTLIRGEAAGFCVSGTAVLWKRPCRRLVARSSNVCLGGAGVEVGLDSEVSFSFVLEDGP